MSVSSETDRFDSDSASNGKTLSDVQDRDNVEQQALEMITSGFETILKGIQLRSGGIEDVSRDGVIKTPLRAAKAVMYLTSGYTDEAKVIADAKNAIFDIRDVDHADPVAPMDASIIDSPVCGNFVAVIDIDVASQCEHHLIPFGGKAHIAYIAGNYVVGLSKLPRIVDVYSRRLQVQEKLTKQIANALHMIVPDIQGVMVVIECSHGCVGNRGVQKPSSATVSQYATGVYKQSSALRAEFQSYIKSSRK